MLTKIDKRAELIIQRFESNEIDYPFVKKAYEYARSLHKTQTRKDGTPYISHPVEVALILSDLGFDRDVVSAALLHDVVEDCDVTTQDIIREFNINVAELVDAVSAIDKNKYIYDEDELYEDQNFVKSSAEEQTFKKLIQMGNKNPLSFCIKFADRIHNLRTIDAFPYPKQVEKVRETERWILPIAQILGAKYFYTEMKNLCFKILHKNDEAIFLSHYRFFHDSNKKNFKNVVDLLKSALVTSPYIEIVAHEKLEIDVYENIKKTYKGTHLDKVMQDHIHKVSNYNIYVLHQDSTNEKMLTEVMQVIESKYKNQIKIIDANISIFSKMPFYLIVDNFKNKYNIHIMSKTDFQRRMLGTIDGMLDNLIDESNTHNIPTEFIKIRDRDNKVRHIQKDSTVLDFAFRIHKDLGFAFNYAIINDSPTKHPAHTKLNEGDKVKIIPNEDKYGHLLMKPELKWIAYCNTDLAKKALVKYFERMINDLKNK